MKTSITDQDERPPRVKLSWTARLVVLGLLLSGAAILYLGSPGLPTAETAPVAPIADASRPVAQLGMKAIEELRPGDIVVSRDEKSGQIGRKQVLDAFQRITCGLRILEIRSHDGQNVQRIETTDEHPFWVRDVGFVEAGKLQVGDRLDQSNGGAATVVSTGYEPHPEGVPVYNIKVADYHTYFVAAQAPRAPPLFVHNAPCAPRDMAGVAAARHTAWASDMDKINRTMSKLGMRALRQSGENFAKSESLLATYGEMMNRRFRRVGSTKLAVREAAVWNGSGLKNGGRGTRAPSFRSDGSPVKGTSRIDLAIVSTALPGNPVVSGIDISLNYFKPFKLDKYKRAFGDIPMADIRYSRNLFDPNAPFKNYIKWY